ncbi:MAG: SusC/RagA family TonB-linked outer membrane protein [Flavobacteriaceae bacterium]|nr:SusC/RagA family TonB-linked outer membrane protein [Flavobacteriaceae bacterium]
MFKKLVVILAFVPILLWGQNKTVTGTVTGAGDGMPLPGVTVLVKGTNQGTSTDFDGNYSIKVKEGVVLQFSYVGFTTKEIKVNGGGNSLSINVLLKESAEALEEVVVTALGIKRQEKALSYNVQQVKSEELTTVKDANFMNSLSGKVAGVNIKASSAGIGGATRVVMRGPKSINQSNQALYVIDGIPMFNSNGGETGGMYAAQPGSEGIADINPEDIENISVLSGPAAAALYGSAAAQGVIMITTKKGKEGKVSVNVSSNTTFSSPFEMHQFQNEYVNRPGEVTSWGAKTPSAFGEYNPKKYFDTSINVQNTVSLTTGTDKKQTYLSVGNTNANGILPNSLYDRYNFTYRNTTRFLDDKMTLDFGISYIIQKDQNLTAQGQYFNPVPAVYLFPRGENFDAIRVYELFNSVRGIYEQNWNFGDALKMQNPYWVSHRMNRVNKKNRYMANASLKYQILDWLDITGRIRLDDARTKFEDKRYASTILLFTGGSPYGYYRYSKLDQKAIYGDLMMNINKTMEDFSVSSNLGVSLSHTIHNTTGFGGGLKAPSNVFTPNGIDYAAGTGSNAPVYGDNKHRINSAFGSVELGWKNQLFLTLTGRNDWDSALYGTDNESFFYPSVGFSSVLSQMFELPEWITFMKMRGSWASVGSAIPANITSNWRYPYDSDSQSYGTVTYKYPKTFYPERTDSWEAGLATRLFHGAVTLDATVYKSNTKKQTFLRGITPTGGYNQEYIQTGNVENKGIELAIGFNKKWDNFKWNSTFTYSMNRNKIKQLLDDPKEVLRKGGLANAEIILKQGGTMGDVYVSTDFKRDLEGNIALSSKNNVMQQKLDNPQYVGTVLPKANFGLVNNFTWKNVNFGFMISARLGGIVLSQTQAILDEWGVSQRTADARNNGGINVNTGKVDVEGYYRVVGGESPIWSDYIYSATNVRLQEIHIGYELPKKWFKDKVKLSVGVNAHNVFMIYNKAPFDPEMTPSTGTYYQGFDYFMQPSLRSIGANIKLQFN